MATAPDTLALARAAITKERIHRAYVYSTAAFIAVGIAAVVFFGSSFGLAVTVLFASTLPADVERAKRARLYSLAGQAVILCDRIASGREAE